ncbi:RNA polymerase sigma factor [Candidatus Laterigemmans baculatus]|uniref:RNA polymerase sigma factor n=1 Tax=Candidatus Laterigemmans baculatus TaxID=2770505 RepID=UPI00193BB3AA|nr:sigma-70 family RNA polymerase sigma factor [Candidatus Laterigemmans baculatus]
MSDSTPFLVRRYLDDDPSAFAQLVGRYQDRVFRLCFRMLGHRQDAEDATQETFTRVARHLRGWDAGRPIEPWLLAIAGNRCRTLLSRRRLTLPLLAAAEPASDATEAERQAEQLEEEVHVALAGLRPQHRQAFLLFHRSELSYAEIAERMECPVGTVKTWVHRARVDLIRQLRQREVLAE